jgi:hypothetical protein
VGQVNGCNNDIVRSISTDGGATFTGGTTDVRSLPTTSDEGSAFADQFMHWSALGPNGNVIVSYYDRKYGNDTASGSQDITLASASGRMRVTDQSLPPSDEFPAGTASNIQFMGDYSGLAVGPDGVAWPVWTDTRNPNNSFPTDSDPRVLTHAGHGTDIYTRAIPL